MRGRWRDRFRNRRAPCVMPCDQQHAVSVVCGIVDQSKNVGVIAIQVGQHDFRRAHRPCRAVIGNRAPFACRRERNARRDGTGGESLLAQSVENRQSGAVRLSFVRQVVQRLFHGMFVNGIGSDAIQHAYFVEHDAAVGDGAGFVEVQAVHACEGLHGFELLHERVLACQTDGGEREVERGEQYEAFGDHADHASHGGHHAERHWPVETATSQPPTACTCDQMSSTHSGTTRKVMNLRMVLMPLLRSDTVFL